MVAGNQVALCRRRKTIWTGIFQGKSKLLNFLTRLLCLTFSHIGSLLKTRKKVRGIPALLLYNTFYFPSLPRLLIYTYIFYIFMFHLFIYLKTHCCLVNNEGLKETMSTDGLCIYVVVGYIVNSIVD